MKIELGRIDTQKGVIVEVLLDNGTMKMIISSKFTRK